MPRTIPEMFCMTLDMIAPIWVYLDLFGGFLNMVVPQIIQVMDDHDLVLKPAVTTGDPPMVAVNG